LTEIQIAINCTINVVTKPSPLELLSGKEWMPLNILIKLILVLQEKWRNKIWQGMLYEKEEESNLIIKKNLFRLRLI